MVAEAEALVEAMAMQTPRAEQVLLVAEEVAGRP